MVFHFWYFESPVNRPRFQYRPPNFSAPPLSGAPEARFTPAPADGVLPDGFFSTTNLPTYVKLPSGWRRPRLPRMDCVIVQTTGDDLVTTEPRRVRKADKVAVGAAEDGAEGIFVHVEGGHGLHMRAINAIRRAGSIERAVGQGIAKSGIMHALVTHRIPYVLAGSIRDDGPLPDVIPDTLAAQDAMRGYTSAATFAVL